MKAETGFIPPASAIEAEIAPKDPNVEMLDKGAMVKLWKNGMTDGRRSKYLDSLHRYGFGSQITGGSFRRDPASILHLDVFLAADPDEVKRRSDYSLPADLNVNPFAKLGENPFEARVSEFLGTAPAGDINGMVAEAKPDAPKSNQPSYKVNAWGYKYK